MYTIKIHLTSGNYAIIDFKNEAENAGQKIGVNMAEVFEVVKFLN